MRERAADIPSANPRGELHQTQCTARLAYGKPVLRRDPASQLGVPESDQRHQSQEEQPDWCAAITHDAPVCESFELQCQLHIGTAIAGTLPSGWSHMTAIGNLTLSYNSLSGWLPGFLTLQTAMRLDHFAAAYMLGGATLVHHFLMHRLLS